MPEKHLAIPEGYLHSLVSNTHLWSEGNCARFELQEVKLESGRLGLQRINFNRHVSVTISLVDKVHSLLGSVQFSFTLAMSNKAS